jgi:hypothetical protein
MQEKLVVAEVWQPDVLSDEQVNGYSLQFVALLDRSKEPDPVSLSALHIAEDVFRMCNGVTYHTDEDTLSLAWYDETQRSMMVGDVLIINGLPLRCENNGWSDMSERWQ